MKKFLFLPLVISLLFINCKKSTDDEPIIAEKPIEKPVVEAKLVADYPVQDFMWKAMNAFYFWQEDVSDLADTRFATDSIYAEYLSNETNPEEFFYKICNKHERIVGDATAVDRFSFLSENYKDLTQGFAGISKSNGLEFRLSRYSTGNGVYGYVTYVIPNSNAATKDIKRGDFFTKVNGVDLNLENYRELLFGDTDTYTLDIATVVNNTITPTNKPDVTLTKEEGLQENPILIKKVIDYNGLKIGYLLYNSFVANYDEQLNDAFGEFKTANINELILDFRYNGGGRGSSAIQIASSVYGSKTNELFMKRRYNSKIQSILNVGEGENNFTDKTIDGTTLNTLDLSSVYVITSGSTASASELVINGLEPYVNVIQVGTTTVGKNEFSNTLVDDIDNGYFYSQNREENINPDNQWAIQPLFGRVENADGFSDYTGGLVPDHVLGEDPANLGVLGDVIEPLLALTLNAISGTTAKIDFTPAFPVDDVISSSTLYKPMNNLMLMDGLINPIK